MAVPHYMASGMGGIRSAGDLVARMEYNSNMKVDKAKEYVAKKLGISTLEIADECIMRARCSPRYRRQDEHREAA